MAKRYQLAILLSGVAVTVATLSIRIDRSVHAADDPVAVDAQKMIAEGRQTFRFDTFGDEKFWGDTLRLHQAVEGAKFGGVGPGLSPVAALRLGLKVDSQALPPDLQRKIAAGRVNLDDPATTLALLRLQAVVGVKGFFNSDGSLKSMGIQCALCHSTVDNSFAPGIGKRLDGWANRDLNVGAIIALAPNLQPLATLLGTDTGTVQTVLHSWGPGKFDAELVLDGKAFNPRQISNGIITGENVPGATLIPPAFGMAGVNLHTWTGWGSVTHWNAFVATLEMHGVGRFFDPRLDDPTRFPIAAKNGFADLPHIDPDDDQITKKLPALHFYQLALRAPAPQPGRDFDPAAAKRGDDIFEHKAGCNNCHVEPLWTEPGWNLHKPSQICIDDFQANRGPADAFSGSGYRTSPLAGLFTHQKGGFFHDGRFRTLLDVVNHYDTCFSLGLSAQEKSDLIQYLLSL
jgi:hypothetical protein